MINGAWVRLPPFIGGAILVLMDYLKNDNIYSAVIFILVGMSYLLAVQELNDLLRDLDEK